MGKSGSLGRVWPPRSRSLLWVGGVGVACSVAASVSLGEAGAESPGLDRTPRHTPDRLSWTDSSCNGCHQTDAVFSHPVGFKPDRDLPGEFPLEQGRMTCVTCHDSGSSAQHARARSGDGALLRAGAVGADLCTSCHESSLGSFSSAHAQATGKAHLRWEAPRTERLDVPLTARLDQESSRCLECHDGSLAMDVDSGVAGGGFDTMLASDHPVGVPYRRSKEARSFTDLVHPGAMDGRVRLFDGTVGCGSCHSVYSDKPRRLVMSNLGSALCLSCHQDG